MLSLIELSGSPFQIGQTLGRFGAEAAHRHLVKSASWESVMAWRGSRDARAMQALTQQHFPQIHEELQGLAAGLDLPAEDVFLWNCRGDLWAMSPDGCTTVQNPLPQGSRITHNEDGDPGFAGYCGLGLFAPANGPAFASFVYPASIPGHTFAVNEHGLAMTVNNLRSREVSPGVPRMVLTRAILNQASVEEGLNVLRSYDKAGGFHLSLMQRGATDLISVEFNAMGVSVQVIEQPAVHANHVIHSDMRDFPQVITESSLRRQERGTELLDGADTDPLMILSDQSDRTYPIFRMANDDSDNENTLATADIRINGDHIAWEVYERPHVSSRYTLVDAKLASPADSYNSPRTNSATL